MSKKKITKAVIAAAGFGTRFLPQTKAMPKEMMPLVDKPIIQYIVEELAEAGIEDIIIVTGYHKRSIEDHFDYMSAELRTNLKNSGKTNLFLNTKKISDLANFAYVRQKGPYGNATPLLNVQHLIGDEPFIYTFADDFVVSEPSRFKQLMEVYDEYNSTVLSAVRISNDTDYKSYGFVGGKQISHNVAEVETIIEKPGSKEKSPSDLASVSGYIMVPDIFEYLSKRLLKLQENEEFIMQTAMQDMIKDGHNIYACQIQNGKYYDTGNKLEYLKTVVDFALMHDEIKHDFRAYLNDKIHEN